jgi:alkylation response protein AidB-like acyl-CoA dehydrogenase
MMPERRVDLHAWQQARPANFFEADRNLQRVLRMRCGEARFAAHRERLAAFGAACATTIDAAARLNDRPHNHPRLDRYTDIGERTEGIEFHPSYHEAGRAAYASGVLAVMAEPGNALLQSALFYLLCHNGEMGHACPIACTAGLILALQHAAAPELRARFLPPLLETDYDRLQHGAQFLTEVQGGSDVGANAVRAAPEPDAPGVWRIHGEKWFCSNINAHQFLLTARPDGAPQGTRGLGLFLVPRTLDDGGVNAFRIRRLKTKIGTRTMASAEVDFEGALAYQVGPLEHGFRTAVELVLNTSRYLNAVACAGFAARALLEARSYADHRHAFGQPIISYPLVQENLALLAAETWAALSSSMRLAALLDRIAAGVASDGERATARLLVNLNKLVTSVAATECVHRAIEVLGGNGAIEDFSVLPRLYRDAIVLESWEGTHNVLSLQALRDMARYGLHTPFLDDVTAALEAVGQPGLASLRDEALAAVQRARELAARLLAADGQAAQGHARRLAETLMATAHVSYLLQEADWELARGEETLKPDIARLFFDRHLCPGYTPLEDGSYLGRVARVAYGLARWKGTR